MISVSGGGSTSSPSGVHGSNASGHTRTGRLLQQPSAGTIFASGHNATGAQNMPQSTASAGVNLHSYNDMTTVSCSHANSPLHGGYDWDCEENRVKWRGIFAKGTPEKPLKKVLTKALHQIALHPSSHTTNLPGEMGQMTAVDEAWDYVESLLLKLLAMLTARPLPASKADVEVKILAP